MFIGNSKVGLTQNNCKVCHGAKAIGKRIHTLSHGAIHSSILGKFVRVTIITLTIFYSGLDCQWYKPREFAETVCPSKR